MQILLCRVVPKLIASVGCVPSCICKLVRPAVLTAIPPWLGGLRPLEMRSAGGSELVPEYLRVEGGRALGCDPGGAIDGREDLGVEVSGDEAVIDVLYVVGPGEGRLLVLAIEAVHLGNKFYISGLTVTIIQIRMENEQIRGLRIKSSRATQQPSLRESEVNTSRVDQGSDWKERTRHKNSCTVFHKRMQSGFSKTIHSNLEALPVCDLKEQLAVREKYLQELIEKIVVNEE